MSRAAGDLELTPRPGPERAQAGAPTRRALAKLTEAGVRFCLWKSVDRLQEGLEGRTDLDILAAEEDSARLDDCLRSEGWIRVDAEPWRRFEDVFDYLRYDPATRRWPHLHVHRRLIMGEKLTKSLRLPLEALYLRAARPVDRVPCAPAELEFVAFILRLCVKLTPRDRLRALRRRAAIAPSLPLLDEYRALRRRCRPEALGRMLEAPELGFVEAAIVRGALADLQSLDRSRQRALRHALRPYRRCGALARAGLAVRRALEQRLRGHGKTLTGRGPMIAVCGPDGAGKSTLADALTTVLGRQLLVRRYYMGKRKTSVPWPRRSFYVAARWPHGVVVRILESAGMHGLAGRVRAWFRAIEDYLLAEEKAGRYRAARALCERGGVALFERFPLFSGGGDGLPEPGSSVLRSRQAKLFRRMRRPELLLLLEVDPDAAAARKPDHDPEVVRRKAERFRRFREAEHGSAGVVVLDGDAPPEAIADSAMAHIVALLQDRSASA